MPQDSTPAIVVAHEESDPLQAVVGELSTRYGEDYQILAHRSDREAQQELERLRRAGVAVVLVVAPSTMVDLMERARALHPGARRLLLHEVGDQEAAGHILRHLALGRAESYLHAPVAKPDELFHRQVTEHLAQAQKESFPFAMVSVVGERWAPRSHEFRDLLSRYGVPFRFHPIDDPGGRTVLEEAGASGARLPVLIMFDGRVLEDPSNAEVVEAFGAAVDPTGTTYDLAVVGAGPAGLGAAVYAASEGLRTVVIEREAIGGQAGTSSMIRNYLGFPQGIGGAELSTRAYEQASRFGATFCLLREVTSLEASGGLHRLVLADGGEVTARAVVLATGVTYRRLGVPGLDALVGAGVFYGGASTEAPALSGADVFVIGGANSAGQGAVHLARNARSVTMLVRGGSLAAGMSSYLIKEIEATPNLTVRTNAEVVDGGGDGRLERITIRDRRSDARETVPAAALFVMIGAAAHTEWLPEAIVREPNGYIVTGGDLNSSPERGWPLDRPPLPFETSLPGVFAVGDVRSASVKRVAVAAGEGSVAVPMIHEHLAREEPGR